MGQNHHAVEEDMPNLSDQGQQVAERKPCERSKIGLDDVDVFFVWRLLDHHPEVVRGHRLLR